jgi:hypothetical protein
VECKCLRYGFLQCGLFTISMVYGFNHHVCHRTTFWLLSFDTHEIANFDSLRDAKIRAELHQEATK